MDNCNSQVGYGRGDPCRYFTEEEAILHGEAPAPGWYFYTETWADICGPYKTRNECQAALVRYAFRITGMGQLCENAERLLVDNGYSARLGSTSEKRLMMLLLEFPRAACPGPRARAALRHAIQDGEVRALFWL